MITDQNFFLLVTKFESNYKMLHPSITSMFTDTAGLVTAQILSYTCKETSARGEGGGDKITKMIIFFLLFSQRIDGDSQKRIKDQLWTGVEVFIVLTFF